MAVDDVRVRARQRLEELIGVDEAAFVVSDRPAGGWDSLVTHDQLRAELAGVRTEIAEVRTEIAHLASELRDELREQTWRLTTALLATVTLMTVILRVT